MQRSTMRVVVGGLIALALASMLFVLALEFVPAFWKSLAESLSLPRMFYDAMGLGGLTFIAMSVIALKCGLFGGSADKHPIFIEMNVAGGLMHLVSFGYYYNPNGIALDTIYSVVGLVGLLDYVFISRQECTAPAHDAPALGKFVAIVGGVQLALVGMVWVTWPSVMEVAKAIGNDAFFHYAGMAGGIMILTTFLGQMLGLVDSRSWMFTLAYSIGILGYILNLSVEFNPYTVSLELLIFIFLFYRIRK